MDAITGDVNISRLGWLPGDDPTLHPNWREQVELEERMHRDGAAAFQEQLNKARGSIAKKMGDREVKRGATMAALKPHRSLIKKWIPLIIGGIGEYIRDTRLAKGGPRPIALAYLEKMDKGVAAYLTLRTVLNTIGSERYRGVISLAREIGLSLEHEQRMAAWEKRDRKLFHAVRRGLKEQGATDVHRRRVNINRFNKLMRDKLDWQDWPQDDRMHVGLALIDILVRYTRMFEVGEDPHHVFNDQNYYKKPLAVLVAKPELLDFIKESLERIESLSAHFQPTIMPPKRWNGIRAGGYYTEYVRPPNLVRFKAHQEDQARGAADEYDSLDMPQVLAAIHTLQEVPWRINARVMAVAEEAWKRDLAIGGLPLKETPPEPPKAPPGADANTIKDHKRARADWWSHAHKNISTVFAADRTLRIARDFAGKTFYFPHMLDFRGRIYPIPVDLQPQGRDLARGLLTFARGPVVTPESAGWLAIQLASCYGVDKVSYDERIAWVEERLDTWLTIADEPLGSFARGDHWSEADKPWQALAAIFEWVGYLRAADEGREYVSTLPIYEDGTCNGIQHLSAMTRDADGGALVNLIPSDTPQDIYQVAADDLTETLRGIVPEGGDPADNASFWLDHCEGRLPRQLTKRPVMVLPYGGSLEAFFKYVRVWLEENPPSHGIVNNSLDAETDEAPAVKPEVALRKFVWSSARKLAVLLLPAVHNRVPGAVAVMKWLKECAALCARGDQPIYWTTPDGFVVRHFYGKMKRRIIETRIDGKRFQFEGEVPTTKLDEQAQLRGIPPNFVHSLDACAARMTINAAKAAGINSISCIHDAFAAAAGDMNALHQIIRKSFVETHRVPVLEEFRRACQTVLGDHIAAVERMERGDAFDRADTLLPNMLPMGTLDIEQVLDSDYFFS